MLLDQYSIHITNKQSKKLTFKVNDSPLGLFHNIIYVYVYIRNIFYLYYRFSLIYNIALPLIICCSMFNYYATTYYSDLSSRDWCLFSYYYPLLKFMFSYHPYLNVEALLHITNCSKALSLQNCIYTLTFIKQELGPSAFVGTLTLIMLNYVGC